MVALQIVWKVEINRALTPGTSIPKVAFDFIRILVAADFIGHGRSKMWCKLKRTRHMVRFEMPVGDDGR